MDTPDFLPVVEDYGLGAGAGPAHAVAVNVVDAFTALHAEARALTAIAHVQAQKTAEDQTRDLVRRTAAAQDALCARLRAALPALVRMEAGAGGRQATLLTFVGADVFTMTSDNVVQPEPAKEDEVSSPAPVNTDFCYLHLLKGPKDHDRRREMVGHGFEPLLMRLRRELAPFRVQHYWDQATNTNYVLVGW